MALSPTRCVLFQARCGFCTRTGTALAHSEFLDVGFRLQQDRDPVANGIHSLALVALKGSFAAHDQWFSAYRTSEYFQQVRADHGCDFSKKIPRRAASYAR